MLAFLDIAFFVFHTGLMGFNLVGWMWRRTRVAHLIALSLTAFSWFVLGAFYGWGYCFCTDWHFRVREQLGYADPDTNYVQLLVNKLFGASITAETADWIALAGFVAIVIATAVVWWRDWRSNNRRKSALNVLQ
jgi:hypothetical protein